VSLLATLLPLVALLQAGQGQPSILQSPMIPIGVTLLLLWLFIIRPQQKRQREHDDMLKASAEQMKNLKPEDIDRMMAEMESMGPAQKVCE